MRRFIIKIALLIIIAFSILQVASASIPNNQVTQLFEDEVINGMNEIGDLLIIPINYNPEYINHSNFTTLTTQRYDSLRWLGNESITITNPSSQQTIIVPNGIYNFPALGVYQVQSVINSSNSFTTIVGNEPQNLVEIQIQSIPNGMQMNFSDESFVLSEEEVIEVTLTIDNDIEPDDYVINYSVGNVNKSYEFELLENYAWNITDVTFDSNQTIKAGETKYIGVIEIENTGNMDNEIVITKSGNRTELVSTQDKKTIFVDTTIQFDIQLQIPSVTKTGEYDIEVFVQDLHGNSESVNLSISVVDSTLPSIDNITFSSNKAFTDNQIVVYATDNNDVTNVTLEYDNKVIQLKKDANRFTTTQNFNKISQYAFVFCAYDESDNKVCTQELKRFVKTDVISGNLPSIKMPSVKYATYSRAKLFELNETLVEPLIIELLFIESAVPDDTSYQVRIVDSANAIKRFDAYENAIEVTKKGIYYLEVRSDEELEYQGSIRLVTPEYVTEVSDITFSVGFKNYDVPNNFVINDIYGSTTNCTPHDTGNFDTSYQLCPIKVPFNVEMEDIVIPMTLEEKNRLKAQAGEVQQEFNKSKRRTATIISILVVLLLVLVYAIYFMIDVYPYIRVKEYIEDKD